MKRIKVPKMCKRAGEGSYRRDMNWFPTIGSVLRHCIVRRTPRDWRGVYRIEDISITSGAND